MTGRRLTDDEVARLRTLAVDEGWSPGDLGKAFGISPQYAGRLARGQQRAVLDQADDDADSAGVTAAVERFLEQLPMTAEDMVLAATARAVAAKVDATAASSTGVAAHAMPRLVAQLVDVLDRLRGLVPHETELDRIQARRAARLAARDKATTNNGGKARER